MKPQGELPPKPRLAERAVNLWERRYPARRGIPTRRAGMRSTEAGAHGAGLRRRRQSRLSPTAR